jgi:hypothetical protein
VQALKFEHEAQQVAFADCVAEVLHMGERLARLDKDIDRLVLSAPPHMRAVIEALQSPYARTWLATATASAGVRAKPWLPRLKTIARKLGEQYERLPWDQQPHGNSDLSFVRRAIEALEKSR